MVYAESRVGKFEEGDVLMKAAMWSREEGAGHQLEDALFGWIVDLHSRNLHVLCKMI